MLITVLLSHSNLPDQLRLESQDPHLVLVHIQNLAQQLYTNENPNPQPYKEKVCLECF